MFMGGNVPLGYVVKDRKLVVSEPEATIVRSIFERFLRIGSATVLARELRTEGVRTRRGKLVDKGYLYKLLNNRTYPPRAGRPQRHGLPRRARGHHPAGPVGQGARDPRREHPHPLRQHPGADAGAAEGADLRADRCCHVADPHAQGVKTVLLLR
jgi:hypothetical protein